MSAERERLCELFVELCRIDSPSGRERACADRVKSELEQLGLEVHEDDAGAIVGGDTGNLLATVPGPDRPAILLCAHLDTVPALAPIEPLLEDGAYRNANEAILGADNKAAIAVIIAAVRRALERGGPAVPIELLFTVGEETSLAGAKAFDASRLRSRHGYVLDHASPIGEVVMASPTLFRIDAEIRGVAAHAGIRPEQGRSAIYAAAQAIASMRLGRLDDETTANVGLIEGGTAINVVPERTRIAAEARSLDDARAEQTASEMIDRIHDAANLPDCECDVDVSVGRLFRAYRTPPSSPALAAAEAALRACGYEPRRIVTGGASDANALEAQGFRCVNLANGTERNHQPDERVSVAALAGMLEVVAALIEISAEAESAEAA